jgi:hypothetical protein
MSLRVVTYLFAVAMMAITVPFTLAAGAQGLVVAFLGGTLAITPYMVVRAFEEVRSESLPWPETTFAVNSPGDRLTSTQVKSVIHP